MARDLVRIGFQGEVVVEYCSLVYDGEEVKILSLNLKTKYAVVGGYCGNPGVILHATDRSIHTGEEEGCTEVVFPRFKGYRAIASDCGRYTCFVALLKESFFMKDDEFIETEYVEKS